MTHKQGDNKRNVFRAVEELEDDVIKIYGMLAEIYELLGKLFGERNQIESNTDELKQMT